MNLKSTFRKAVLFFHFFLIILCSGCITYHLPNDEKYHNFFPVKDVHVVSSTELDNCKFSMEQFRNPDTSGVVQFLLPENIRQIVTVTKKDLLVIFYFPNCSGADSHVQLAKFAEENNISYLLVSDTYSPTRMKELYLKYRLKNRNQYIIPTVRKKQADTLRKRLEFMKEISPENYAIFKDGLIFKMAMKVSINDSVNLNPKFPQGANYKESMIDWIKQEFHIAK